MSYHIRLQEIEWNMIKSILMLAIKNVRQNQIGLMEAIGKNWKNYQGLVT